MEKRTLFAIVLSIAVLIIYQVFFTKPVVQPPPPSHVTNAAITNEIGGQPKAVTQPQALKPQAMGQPQGVVVVVESTAVVETDLYKAAFTTKGGTLKSFELKNYKDKDGQSVFLLKDRGMYPALAIGAGEDFSTISNANFSLIGGDLKLNASKRTGTLVFEYQGGGVSVRRTYTFYSDSYKFDLKDEVSGLPEYEIVLGTDFGISSRKEEGFHIGPVLLTDIKRIELVAKKLKEKQTFTGALKWIAQEDKYFFAAIVPTGQMAEAKAWANQGSEAIALKGPPARVQGFIVYAGPKEHERLKALGAGLEHIIDFGFFSIIARPLFWFLKFLHQYLGNYGWAIIFLTIVVRIPFIPIISKGQKAMKKLQDVQPHMAEIREKYKKDPQRMQKELMEVYKKYKVNPMSGCLPMLLQIPVFFALYKVLGIALELRDAPFMFWVKDLSQKDPYYILPIVMGITMVIQQKMTPSVGDPKQQKLMMFMPVIFTFMFLNFASGLVIYWLVNNLLSIGQQYYINKKK